MLGCSQSSRDVTTANLLKRKLVKNVVGLQKFDQELRVSYKPTAFRRWVVDGVVFVSGDFTETLRTVTAEDFVYLDPPYFNTKGMYGETFESSRLWECLEHLNRVGVRWMMSYDGKSGDGDHTVDIPKTCTDGMSISSLVFPHSGGS